MSIFQMIILIMVFFWSGWLYMRHGLGGNIPVFEFLVGTAALIYIWRVITEKKNN
jgi:hypothetical protein